MAPPPPPPPPPPAPGSSRAPLTATKSCPSSTPSEPPASLKDAIRSHKGLKKPEPVKSKSLDFQDELKARISQRRKAVSGKETVGKGIAESLSDMISEKFTAETSDSSDDSSAGDLRKNTFLQL